MDVYYILSKIPSNSDQIYFGYDIIVAVSEEAAVKLAFRNWHTSAAARAYIRVKSVPFPALCSFPMQLDFLRENSTGAVLISQSMIDQPEYERRLAEMDDLANPRPRRLE